MKQFAVKVENEEQYNKLMKACEENGYKWYTSEHKPTEGPDLEISCFSVDDFPWFLALNDDRTIGFIACENYRDVKYGYPLIPFHLAMSYIYGDYKYHYGARVWTENTGWGKIKARVRCDKPIYLVKSDTPSSGMTGGVGYSFYWGDGHPFRWYMHVPADKIKFSAPEEPEPLKCSLSEVVVNDDNSLAITVDVIPFDKEKCYTAIRNHNTVIVILSDGRKGYAVCSPRDEFDFQTGFELAYRRAVQE